VPGCVPDRRLPRALPARCATLHLVPDDRAQGTDPGGVPRGDRQPHLRLRRLPRGLPVEQVRRQCRAPPRVRPARRARRTAACRAARARRRRLPPAVLGLADQAHRPRPVRAQLPDRRGQQRQSRARSAGAGFARGSDPVIAEAAEWALGKILPELASGRWQTPPGV
jgi:hypothetical protein